MLPTKRSNSSVPMTPIPTSKPNDYQQEQSSSYSSTPQNNTSQKNDQQSSSPEPPPHNHQQQQEQDNKKLYFLTPKACTNLLHFKYSGADLSYIYKYILSPLAQFCVDYLTPSTVAPNAITLFGFGWMICSYCIIWYYCPTLDNAVVSSVEEEEKEVVVPRWIFLFNFAAMLIYQTLDNMDGKQARKTGASSPLGLIFDHGCDAANSILGSANWICAWGYNPSADFVQIWWCVTVPMALFFIATWEEYYTGSLILPVVNGPSEGLLFGASLSLISFLYGVEFWQESTFFDYTVGSYLKNNNNDHILPEKVLSYIPSDGIRNNDFLFCVGAVASVFITVLPVLKIVRTYGLKTLKTFSTFVVLAVLTYVPFAVDPTIVVRNPRTYLMLAGVLFTEIVTQLMLDHVTDQQYNPYRLSLGPLVLFTVLILLREFGGEGVMRMMTMSSDRAVDDYLLAYTVGITVYLLVKIKILIYEMCTVLKIWCFDIVTPYYSTEDGEGVLVAKKKVS